MPVWYTDFHLFTHRTVVSPPLLQCIGTTHRFFSISEWNIRHSITKDRNMGNMPIPLYLSSTSQWFFRKHHKFIYFSPYSKHEPRRGQNPHYIRDSDPPPKPSHSAQEQEWPQDTWHHHPLLNPAVSSPLHLNAKLSPWPRKPHMHVVLTPSLNPSSPVDHLALVLPGLAATWLY